MNGFKIIGARGSGPAGNARAWAWAILLGAMMASGAQGQQLPQRFDAHAPPRYQVPHGIQNPGSMGHVATAYLAQGPTAEGESQYGFGEVPIPTPQQHQIPVWRQPAEGQVDLNFRNGLVSLVVRDAPLNQVLSMLAQNQGLNIVCAENISARISVVLHDVTLDDALTAVLSTAGYTWIHRNGIMHVTSLAAGKNVSPDVQGRSVEVFSLDYAAGDDVDQTIKGLLSPVGQSFLTQSSADDLRKTKDVIVVEDVPAYLARIRDYVQQVDQPPRQVLIEVHVLEVDLEDNKRHGVNFKHMASLLNNTIEFELAGAANPLAAPAFFARIGGGNLETLVECLKTTIDAKTLASPSVLVVDGQEARIQIGERLGYRVTTTTETSTMESVDFLDVGVVLTVTPHISRDSRVLMQVKPKVSGGRINPDTGLPEEQTKEVETNVLLGNCEGMVIGGLIQETDTDIQSKIPWLGDIWLVGKLFQRRQVDKKRSEIIVVLIPRVQPYLPCDAQRDDIGVHRCQTPLFTGPLERTCRPWEPELLNSDQNPMGRWRRGRGRWMNAPYEAQMSEQPLMPTIIDPAEADQIRPETSDQPANPEDPEIEAPGQPPLPQLDWGARPSIQPDSAMPTSSPRVARLPPVEGRWR